MARKNVLTPAPAPTPDHRKGPMPPRGTVGALQSSLSKLQENAVQDIDPALIDDAGMVDRLGIDGTADKQLRDSLETYGQQVPVLLRPKADAPGRFEIVYGRRRLRALKALRMPVKAMVRQLDDHALVMAQGQENTSRQDLSFIEKASFCAQLDEAGYDRQTISAALSVDMPMVSRMLKVGTAFDLEFLRQIGSAPGIGRDRWMKLVKLMQDKRARSHVSARMRTPDFKGDSDTRFEQVFGWASKATQTDPKPPKPDIRARVVTARDGDALAEMKRTPKGLNLTIANRDGFAQWLEDNAAAALQELHDRYRQERSEEDQRKPE